MTDIWTPLTLGKLELKNRLVMAPMTRSRAEPSGVPDLSRPPIMPSAPASGS